MMHLMQCTGNEGQGGRQESKPDFIVFYVLMLCTADAIAEVVMHVVQCAGHGGRG